MRRFYSFMLMATMLFIGANAWASFNIVGGDSYGDLQAAINAVPAGTTAEIQMTTNHNFSTPIWLGTENATDPAKHIVLDLLGNQLVFNGSAKIAIAITHGTLELKSTQGGRGSVESSETTLDDLIRVYGTYQEVNAKTGIPYARLIVGENVEVKHTKKNVLTIDVMRPGQATLFGKEDSDIAYACDFFYAGPGTKTDGFGVANGARIDVYGDVISGAKYGIKVNGCVRYGGDYMENNAWKSGYPYLRAAYAPATFATASAAAAFAPYVYIAPTGSVTTDASAKSAVAAYSSGFATWRIEGYCGGSTGLYVKSGTVELVNAQIASTNTTATQPTGKGSGVDAGGSAIVVETNSNYSGNISVVISGDTKVSATSGYAIEETITATSGETEVETITITGGTFDGGNKGSVIVEDKTVAGGKVSVVGGSYSSTNSTQGGSDIQIDNGNGGTTTISPATLDQLIPTAEKSQLKAIEITIGQETYHVIVPKDGYNVKLNARGLATFSAAEQVGLPSGWTAYVAGELQQGEYLNLSEITEISYIPAGVGVVLYGDPNAEAKLEALNPQVAKQPAFASNTLKPYIVWKKEYAEHAYILHDNELYLYTGNAMKTNKAFVLFAEPNPYDLNHAPARIRMVFEETQDVENIEAGAKAVKFIENGNIFIKRGEKVFNVQGQIVK